MTRYRYRYRYQEARRTAASVVTGAKTQVWEDFGQAMVKDFRLASRKFWQTILKGTAGLSSG